MSIGSEDDRRRERRARWAETRREVRRKQLGAALGMTVTISLFTLGYMGFRGAKGGEFAVFLFMISAGVPLIIWWLSVLFRGKPYGRNPRKIAGEYHRDRSDEDRPLAESGAPPPVDEEITA